MFTRKMKFAIGWSLVGAITLGSLIPTKVNAQSNLSFEELSRMGGLERQELVLNQPPELQATQELPAKLTDAEMQFVLDTNASLLKLATGIDVKTLPFISALFPKKDVIDYERIARDVSKIIKEAFTENNIFQQKANLGTAVTGLKRLAVTETKDDHTTLLYMGLLDNIMLRTSQKDLKYLAAGYWASAAQMNLNAMAYRKAINPTNPKLNDDIRLSARAYRYQLNGLASELRVMQETEIGKKLYECYYNQYGKAVYWDDIAKKPNYFDKVEACRVHRQTAIHDYATNTVYLEEMAKGWVPVEVAAAGGEQGLSVYNKLMDPATARAVFGDEKALGILIVRANFVSYGLSPDYFTKWGSSVCNSLGQTILKAKMEGHYPTDPAMTAKLLEAVGCHA